MHERLLVVRKHLKLTQRQVADVLDIGQSAYAMIEGGKISLTLKNRNILTQKLHINPDYLLYDQGDMLLPFRPTDSPLSRVPQSGLPYCNKPFDDKISSFDDFSRAQAEYFINCQLFDDCNFYRPVLGDSMSPRYNKGDIMACKQILSSDNILFGQTYLCVVAYKGDFYETIRIIRQSSQSDCVTLTTCNEEFDALVLPIEAFRALYVVKGRIERNA